MARPGLTLHRKFRRLSRALGSALLARGALELMWEPCYEAGDPYLGTANDIETLVGWSGEPGVLATALVSAGAPEGAGFIDIVTQATDPRDTTYMIHDLWHHAPDYVMKRHKRELSRKERVAPTAKRRRTAPNGGQRRPSPDRQIEVDRTPAPAPAPAPAPIGKSVSSAPALPDAQPPTVRATFPTVGKYSQWDLTDAHIAEWRAAYPNLDILGECRRAHAWIVANKPNRKTAEGMPKFLVKWFNRSTERPGVRLATDPMTTNDEVWDQFEQLGKGSA